jgi:hypothetical protein
MTTFFSFKVALLQYSVNARSEVSYLLTKGGVHLL